MKFMYSRGDTRQNTQLFLGSHLITMDPCIPPEYGQWGPKHVAAK
jgi:hypothetical protein